MATKKSDPTRSQQTAPDTTTAKQNGKPQDRIEFVDDNLKHGFAQVPRPVIRARGLSCQAKVLYALLLDYAWQNDSCFPGQERLAQDIGKSIDTVQRTLNELRAYRLVDWKQQGLNKPNIYYILRLSECCYLHPDTNLSGKPQICGVQKPHNCVIQKPQKRGTNNTKSKDTKFNNTQYPSRGKASKTKNKEGGDTPHGTHSHIAHTAIRNGKETTQSNGEASKASSFVNPPITQEEIDRNKQRGKNASGLTRIGEILTIPQDHLETLNKQYGTGRPETQSSTRTTAAVKQGKWKSAPLFIQAMISDWFSREMHDQAVHSTITTVANIYRSWQEQHASEIATYTSEEVEDMFRQKMFTARAAPKRANIKTRTPDGKINYTPYFLTCLKNACGLSERGSLAKS